MRNLLLAGVSCVALSLGAASSAQAQSVESFLTDNTWYVSLFGGISFPETSSGKLSGGFLTTTTTTGIAGKFNLRHKTGYTLGLSVGKQVTDRVRGELEVSYTSVNNKNLRIGTGATALSGYNDALFVLGNLWMDFDVGHDIKPYVGGGIGVALQNWELKGGGATIKTSSEDFAFQLGAGVNYPLTRKTDLGVGYRYRSVVDGDYSIGAKFENLELDTHSLLATVTYHLNGP